jgi:hypothetical protein
VRLDLLPTGPRVTARVSGGALPVPGTTVRLTVSGEAFAYPADSATPVVSP